MKISTFNAITKEAIKTNSMIQIPEAPTSFAEYCKISEEQGEEKGLDFLLNSIAKRQIEAAKSPKIKEVKKERVIAFWSKYC